MPLILLLPFLSSYFVVADSATQRPDPRIAEIQKLSDPSLMTDERATKMTQDAIDLVMDQIWKTSELDDIRPAARPEVRAIVEGRRRVPYVKDGVIFFSIDYFDLLTELSAFLAHDSYVVNGSRLDYPNPLLTHPFAASPIFPLLDPPVLYVQNEFFRQHRELLTCYQNKDCAATQTTSFSSSIIFTLLHELSHIALGHGSRASDSYPIEKELAADARAWAGLEKMAGPMASDRRQRTSAQAWFGSPIMLLEFERSTQSGEMQNAMATRSDALVTRLPAALQRAIARVTSVKQREDAQAGEYSIEMKEKANSIFVDGITMPVSEAQLRPLMLPSGVHHVIAINNSRIGYAEIIVTSAERKEVPLAFKDLEARVPTSEELSALQDKRDWFSILLKTSTRDLQPKDRSIAYFHWSALHGLSMDDWIFPDARVVLSDDQKFDVDMWTDSREPLARWH